MDRRGIQIDIPGFGTLDIKAICSDYTGTLSLEGQLLHGVKKRLRQLAELVDIHVVTSDTRGTAKQELKGIPLELKIITGQKHDQLKNTYLKTQLNPKHTAVLGNGRNDRLWLRTVKKAGGLAIAVDTGEGCAVEAMRNANIFLLGSTSALDLLLDPDRIKATLRS
jgi:soluble P-type ATPase